jgi:hypothetical protein
VEHFKAAMYMGVGVFVLLALIFVGPFVLVGVLIYGAWHLWYNSAAKQEERAQAKTQALYAEVLARQKNMMTEAQVQNALELAVPDIFTPEIRYHLIAHARIILDQCDFTTEVPRPPPVANSIEGARYRDTLSKIGALDPGVVSRALDTAIEIARKVSTVVPDTEGSYMVPASLFVGDIRELVTDIIRDVRDQPALARLMQTIMENVTEIGHVLPKDNPSPTIWQDYFKGTPLSTLLSFSVPFSIPEELRTSHHHILAGSGTGKTQLLYAMVADDLKTDTSIVVIDSQRDTIETIAARVPPERLIILDPVKCPPALNIFANRVETEQGRADALDLYEYIFASLEAKLTAKQSLVYRFLSRLCMAVPGATLATMRDMCVQGGTLQYQEHIDKLGDNARVFFAEFEKKGSQYNETRQEVLRRLLQVLETDAIGRMLGSSTMRLNIAEALDSGKVILVDTNSSLLKEYSALFGRIFVALVLQAVIAREKGNRHRTYMYIDEFGDYAEDSKILLDLFAQTRKYELGLIVTHQFLNQLTPQLSASISANTAIKMAAGLSGEDLTQRAKQMRVDPQMIDSQPPGTFLAYFKGIGAIPWQVPIGKFEKTPKHSQAVMEAIYADMRERFGDKIEVAEKPEPTPVEEPKEDLW